MKTFIQKVVPSAAVLALLPSIAFAAGLTDVLKTISSLMNMLVPLALTAAVLVFMYGIVKYLFSGAEKGPAINLMVWGVVAIAVMVSIWGLVGILQSTFGIQGQNTPILPGTVQVN